MKIAPIWTLRSTAILLTGLCAFLAYVSTRAERQRRAIIAIRGNGAMVLVQKSTLQRLILPLSDDLGFGLVGEIDLSGIYVTDEIFREISRLPDCETLILDYSRLDHEGIKRLGGLYGLRRLSLRGASVTDDELATIARLKSLETIDLSDTDICDTGLVHLAGLNQLRSLYLSETRISNDGVRHLRRIATLERLSVDRTNVSLTSDQLMALFPDIRAIDHD